MELDHEVIVERLQTTPPRCLRGLKPEFVPKPGKLCPVWISAWRLVCACGGTLGTVLGHPLGELASGYEDHTFFVSPFEFQCAECGTATQFLDTAVDSAGAELAKLEGAEIGCAAYRGEGPGKPFGCNACRNQVGEVVVALDYNEDDMDSLAEEGIDFPWENLFNWIHIRHTCSSCGKQSVVTDIDAKY